MASHDFDQITSTFSSKDVLTPLATYILQGHKS